MQIDENRARYCPHTPYPKQRAFLDLDCEEAFFGGAAGGGKSDVLLMGALDYIHLPGYHALILRKSYPNLTKAGAIMHRAKQWMLGRTDAQWNEQQKRFTFPSGATLEFGVIDSPTDALNFQGTDYQYISWDELTEFRGLNDDEANPYLFLFRSLRQTTTQIPLRIRAASNPGNIGHAWVKRRFISADALYSLRQGGDGVFRHAGRAFVPSKIKDNPAIDEEDYRRALAHLPPVTRTRLMEGDWDVAESLIISEAWLRRYTQRGDIIAPPDGAPIDCRTLRRFATIDTAGTSRDRAAAQKGQASWSVIGVWDYHSATDLLYLRGVHRGQWGWTDLVLQAGGFLKTWGVRDADVENAQTGPALAEELRKGGVSVNLVGPKIRGMAESWQGAKLDRAIASGLIERLESGRLLLPQSAPWLIPFIAELTGWTGDPTETADQIDMSSYAAYRVKNRGQSWGGVLPHQVRATGGRPITW